MTTQAITTRNFLEASFVSAEKIDARNYSLEKGDEFIRKLQTLRKPPIACFPPRVKFVVGLRIVHYFKAI